MKPLSHAVLAVLFMLLPPTLARVASGMEVVSTPLSRTESGSGVTIDAAFPGGNIRLLGMEGDLVRLAQDLRDTEGQWFYWSFRVRGAQGRSLRFQFTSGVIGARGPAVSSDGGLTWRWLGAPGADSRGFPYQFGPGETEVFFGQGMNYTEMDLRRFLARHEGNPALRIETLCRTAKGRDVELLRISGGGARAPAHAVFLSARHHCGEMMASHALEGIIETALSDTGDGRWLRKNADFFIVPFVDKDGVEDGDQGKNRRPHDHNRDYVRRIYPSVRAITERVPAWLAARPLFLLDLHCPGLRGGDDPANTAKGTNEYLYLVGGAHPGSWEKQQRFSALLEKLREGPMPYRRTNDLPHGVSWNTAKNHKEDPSLQSCAQWGWTLPGAVFSASLEIPFANAQGAMVDAASARALGRDLARALRVFLETAEATEAGAPSQAAPLSAPPPPSTPNYDEAKVPSYVLPDVLRCDDGSRAATAREWEEKRRPEILELFSSQMYGRTPPDKIPVSYEVLSENPDDMGGKAASRQVKFIFGAGEKTVEAVLLMYIPNNGKKKVPVFVGYNFKGNHSTTDDPSVLYSPSLALVRKPGHPDWTRGSQKSRWSYEKIVQRGYAVATMCYHDIYPDASGLRARSVAALFPGRTRATGAPDEWGAIGAWAWGSSRIVDYLETEPRIDCGKIVIMGHSRQGKAALWAGAQDRRFTIVISNDSGCGGAALSKREFGETVARITSGFPHWFCPAFGKRYANNEAALPFDQHELLALMAPRPVYVASAAEDRWADPKGEFLAARHAGVVYELYGLSGLGAAGQPPPNRPVMNHVGYHIRSGKHDVTDYDWECFLDFADKHFR